MPFQKKKKQFRNFILQLHQTFRKLANRNFYLKNIKKK